MSRAFQSNQSKYWLISSISIPVLALFAYWPALSAGFVWDDYYFLFREGGWMLEGSDWLERSLGEFYVFQGDSQDYHTNYFRPLVMLGFVAQMRLGGGDPALLHGVSISIHAANAFLVMALVHIWSQRKQHTKWLAPLAAVIYVLHPALVEPTAWISGQFDLLATFFILIGLVADRLFDKKLSRAAAASTCFFLAALCKELAVVFPILLTITHWQFSTDDGSLLRRVREILRENWRTYLSIFIAGLIYLYLRWTSLGHLIQSNNMDHPWLTRLFMFGYTYIEYWRLAIAPFYDLTPLHEVPAATYLDPTPSLWVRMAASSLIVASGASLLIRRRCVGFAICMFTAALLPVLHFLTMLIGENLYAERFLALPLAVLIAALAASAPEGTKSTQPRAQLRRTSTILILLAFSTCSFLTTRSQVPLWSSNYSLWLWAHQKDPDSRFAANQLLAELITRAKNEKAKPIIDSIEAAGTTDLATAITLSTYYSSIGEIHKALHLVDGVYNSSKPGSRLQTYALINLASILTKMDDPEAAERALRDAVAMSPDSSDAHIYLIRVLIANEKHEEAAHELASALPKVSPLQRNEVQQEIETLIQKSHPSENLGKGTNE